MHTRNTLSALTAGLLLSGTIFSQTLYDGIDIEKLQNFGDTLRTSSAWNIQKIYDAKKHLIPNMSTLRDLPRLTNLSEASLDEIYFANNWVEVKSYFWLSDDNPDEDMFDTALLIPDRKKGTMRLQFRPVVEGRSVPQLVFDDPWNNTTQTFERKGNYSYRHSRNPKETPSDNYSVIVSCDANFLILENTYTGKVGDFNSKRRFRLVYMAVPKTLMNSWNPQAVSPVATASSGSGTVVSGTGSQTAYSPQQATLNFREDQLITGDAADNLRDNFFMYTDKIPSGEALKGMRPGKPVNPILEYDLYDYDWLEVAISETRNGSDSYSRTIRDMDLVRFHPQAGSYHFSLDMTAQADPARLYYRNNWDKQITTVQRQGNFTTLASNGQPAFTVVNYDDGNNILVVDQRDPVSGNVIRIVYLGMPKQF